MAIPKDQINNGNSNERSTTGYKGARAVANRGMTASKRPEMNVPQGNLLEPVPGRQFRVIGLDIGKDSFSKAGVHEEFGQRIRKAYFKTPGSEIIIRGNMSPSVRTSPADADLATRRAESAKALLVKEGIPANSIRIERTSNSRLDPRAISPEQKASMRGATIEIIPPKKLSRPERGFTDQLVFAKGKTKPEGLFEDLTTVLQQRTLSGVPLFDLAMAGAWKVVGMKSASSNLLHSMFGEGKPVHPEKEWILKGWGEHYDDLLEIQINDSARKVSKAFDGGNRSGHGTFFGKTQRSPTNKGFLSDQYWAIGGATVSVGGAYDWSAGTNGQIKIIFHDIQENFHDDYRFREDANLYNYQIQELGWIKPFEVSNNWPVAKRTYNFDPSKRPIQLILERSSRGK